MTIGTKQWKSIKKIIWKCIWWIVKTVVIGTCIKLERKKDEKEIAFLQFMFHQLSILYLTTESKIKMSKLKTKIEKSQNTFIVIAIAIQDSICCQRKLNNFLFATKQPSLFTSFACHQKKVVVWKWIIKTECYKVP